FPASSRCERDPTPLQQKRTPTVHSLFRTVGALTAIGVALLAALGRSQAGDEAKTTTEKPAQPAAPAKESFSALVARMSAATPALEKPRPPLPGNPSAGTKNPADGVTMSGGNPVQGGVRIKLPQGMTWEKLAEMDPDYIREKGLFPAGLLPLPHVNHPGGGM